MVSPPGILPGRRRKSKPAPQIRDWQSLRARSIVARVESSAAGAPEVIMQRWMRRNGRRSFTLIELLVVIAIIIILVALISPALANALEKGRQARCRNNVKNVAGLFAMAAQDNDRRYPSGSEMGGNPTLLMQMSSLTNLITDRKVLRCLSDKGLTIWPVPTGNKSCFDFSLNSSSYAYAAADYATFGMSKIALVSIGQISSPSRKAVIFEPTLNTANTKVWHRAGGYGMVGYADSHADLVQYVTSVIETNAYY